MGREVMSQEGWREIGKEIEITRRDGILLDEKMGRERKARERERERKRREERERERGMERKRVCICPSLTRHSFALLLRPFLSFFLPCVHFSSLSHEQLNMTSFHFYICIYSHKACS